MNKVDKLFEFCKDSLVSETVSNYIRNTIFNLVDSVKNIKCQLKLIEKDIHELASHFDEYQRLMTITGCGPITAATIIAETGDIKRFKNADHYVSYSGSSPKNKRSGSSIETMGKMSKKGSKFLRHALYMVAEFARRHNPVLKAQFDRIKNKNKKRHKLAVVAIANKIARYIYSILKTKSSFIIMHNHISRLPEETRETFFNSITLQIPKNNRRQIYQYCNEYGEVHKFIYTTIKDK